MASGEDDTAGPRVVYFCYECQNTVVPVQSELSCPDCGGDFLEVFPQLGPEFEQEPHILAGYDENQYIGGGDIQYENPPDVGSMNPSDVGSISDLLRRLHLYDDDDDDYMPSVSARYEIPPGFNAEDAVMDSVEWDRVVSWFFENENSFANIVRLPEEQIKSIPVSLVKAEDIAETSACSICIDDFKLREEAKFLPCKHFFHKECISSWLRVRANCPVCRQAVKISDNQTKDTGAVPTASNAAGTSRELNIPSSETSAADEPAHSLSENASSSSGTSFRRQRTFNQATSIPQDRPPHHAPSSLFYFGAGRGQEPVQYTPPNTIRPHGHHHVPDQRQHSSVPADATLSYRFDFPSEYHFQSYNLASYLTDLFFQRRERRGDTVQSSRDGVNSRLPSNSADHSSDNSRNQSSNSNSLEDLSSVVPVLRPNVT